MHKILNKASQETLEAAAMTGVGALRENELAEMMANAFCMQFSRDFNIRGSRVVVFAGPGRIGAVALSCAALLSDTGVRTEAVVLNPHNSLPALNRSLMQRLMESGIPLIEAKSDFRPPKLDEQTIVLDGICGLEEESEKPASGALRGVIRFINSRDAVVVSLEIPSGLRPEDNADVPPDNIIRADHTYTFNGPKLAFLFSENAPYVGEWHLLNVGLGDEKAPAASDRFLIGYSDMEGVLKRRERFTNKYDYGRVLLVAGSPGMMGAALLAGKAAYRSGAGHVTLAVPSGMAPIVHTALPEALVIEGSLPEDLSPYDAVAAGPGLGRSSEARDKVAQVILECKTRLLLDADALYFLAEDRELLDALPAGTVLTPHRGEFDRIFGPFGDSCHRLYAAEEAARQRRLCILLKGAYSATISAEAPVIFNSTGNPALATAGTGDVLTGMVLGFLGKGVAPYEACITSAFLHGYAADLYLADHEAESLIAGDLIRYLPKAMKPFSDHPASPIY